MRLEWLALCMDWEDPVRRIGLLHWGCDLCLSCFFYVYVYTQSMLDHKMHLISNPDRVFPHR